MDKAYSQIYVKRIRSLCRDRDIAINKLAIMSGVSHSTLDNLMNKRTFNPTARTLHKIANAFGMTLAEFLDFPDLNNYSFDGQPDKDEE